MKTQLILSLSALALMGGCVKDIPKLQAGPVNLQFRLEKKSAYAGPYCATVTMQGSQLKADGDARGFWYWGSVKATTLTSTDTPVSTNFTEIKKFDGNTPLGSYGTDAKPFPVVSGGGVEKFTITYSPAYLWALNDCAGCIGMENLYYKEYAFASVTDNENHECGYNYEMVLFNSLKP